MYYKYIGEDKNTGVVRYSFLSDGYFRFTQPEFLNDPKEAKPKLFIEEYSPKDIELARVPKDSVDLFHLAGMTDEQIISACLEPFPKNRYGDLLPHLLHQEGFKSMQEYDEAVLTTTYQRFDVQLNKEVGVFSLSKDNKNEVMWANYANDYNGIVVGFSEDIEYIHGYIKNNINYDISSVGFELSLNSGIIRFNGIKVSDDNDDFNITDDLLASFLFHKTEKWSPEKEYRLISRLSLSDKKIDDVYLERIPFSVYESLFIGCNVPKSVREEIVSAIKSNSSLNHIKVFNQTFHKLTGDIEYVNICL